MFPDSRKTKFIEVYLRVDSLSCMGEGFLMRSSRKVVVAGIEGDFVEKGALMITKADAIESAILFG